MLMVPAGHSFDFMRENDLWVEAHITRTDKREDFQDYEPYIRSIHLPYSGVNLAAYDEEARRASINKVKSAVNKGAQYPVDRMVLHPCAVYSLAGDEVGTYGLAIDSLREIADFMQEKGLILLLENQVFRHPDTRIIGGCHSDDWFQLRKDIGRGNVLLTLDSSHAASASAHEETHEKRLEKLWKFFDHPELIGSFHWSDARLKTDDCQWADIHLTPGDGDLPREFHQAIWNHPAPKLLEQHCADEDMARALKFIATL